MMLLALVVGLTLPALALPNTAPPDVGARALQLMREEDTLADGLDGLDQRIVALTQSQSDNQQIVDRAQSKLAALDHQIDILELRMSTQRARLVRRLRAQQQLKATAWLQVLLTATTPEELVRRRHYLERILGADVALLDSMKADRAMLNLTRGQRVDADVRARKAATTILRERAVLESERALRTELIRRLRGQRRTMRRLLRRRRGQRAGLEPLFVEEGERDEQLGVNSGLEGHFDEEYGLLPRPTPGRVIRRFGAKQNGITIDAPRGAPVRAVYSGRVLLAGWQEGFGNTAIIDHGGGHHSLYAHLARIKHPKDALIAQGEVLGIVGESGSLRGPQLYFEVRVQAQPEDPQRWLRR
ncbi:MAG: septal ring factor EnvC (AmiA/AmiB activator) [Bradymonadia bacterium]|jgi:septal ring factor EnvC (AmiA/AmiB activator)